MTDISELIHRLKVAAKKVTPGPWITVDYFWISQKSVGLGGEFMQFNNGPDAEYVKHCSPDNILTLTAALEKAQARIAELETRTVKLPKPHAHLIWIQAGHAPDDFWDDVTVSHSEKDRSCDGSERYPVYARWEIEEVLKAAGIKWESE